MTALADARAQGARLAERARLLAVLETTRGNRLAAAELLDVTPRHLHRRIAALELAPTLDQLARLHGWYDATPSGRMQRHRSLSR